MKKLMAVLLALLCAFCFVGCGEEKFTTPGYEVLYEYLLSLEPGELSFQNTNYRYSHDHVTIEDREDMICIFVVLPNDSYNHHETISLRLKNNEKEAVVSITFVGDKNKEALYGYIDLTTYSVKTDVIWGLDNWELGEKYGQYLFDGLLSIETRLQNQVGISLKDLGFVNF